MIELFKELEFFSLLEGLTAQKGISYKKYKLIGDEKGLRDTLNHIKNKKILSIDLETDSLDPMRAQIVGISFCDGERACYIDLWENSERTPILHLLSELFRKHLRKIIAHNIKFDLKVLHKFVIVDVTGYGMSFFKKMALGVRFLRRYGRPCSYGRSLRPEELIGMVREAGFVVEESKLLGEDTKAVCLRGKKARNEK